MRISNTNQNNHCTLLTVPRCGAPYRSRVPFVKGLRRSIFAGGRGVNYERNVWQKPLIKVRRAGEKSLFMLINKIRLVAIRVMEELQQNIKLK
jgi:ureidoglycolate hydrolase